MIQSRGFNLLIQRTSARTFTSRVNFNTAVRLSSKSLAPSLLRSRFLSSTTTARAANHEIDPVLSTIHNKLSSFFLYLVFVNYTCGSRLTQTVDLNF